MSDTRPIVLVTTRSFGTGPFDARRALEDAGADVRYGPVGHEFGTTGSVLAQTVAWIAGTAPITADHIAAAPRLRLIARYGAGVDSVDLDAATRRGVMVTNTPGANSEAVADHTVALVLAALRDVTGGDRRVRSGDWSVARATELSEATVGIAGLGRVGQAVVRRLRGFGCRILGYDPYLSPGDFGRLGVETSTFELLAERCDVVSLHAPGVTPLVDADWLSRVPGGLLLVNTARAVLVDESALAAALRDGRVRCYATDVLSTETGRTSELLDADLTERTIFSPHAGAQTVQAVDRMGSGTVAAVLAVLSGRTPDHIVNSSADPLR